MDCTSAVQSGRAPKASSFPTVATPAARRPGCQSREGSTDAPYRPHPIERQLTALRPSSATPPHRAALYLRARISDVIWITILRAQYALFRKVKNAPRISISYGALQWRRNAEILDRFRKLGHVSAW